MRLPKLRPDWKDRLMEYARAEQAARRSALVPAHAGSANGAATKGTAPVAAPVGKHAKHAKRVKPVKQAVAPAARVKLPSVSVMFWEEGEDPREGKWPVLGAKPSWLHNAGTYGHLVKAKDCIKGKPAEPATTDAAPLECSCACCAGPDGKPIPGLPDAGQGWHWLTKEWIFGTSQAQPNEAVTRARDSAIQAALMQASAEASEDGDAAENEQAIDASVAADAAAAPAQPAQAAEAKPDALAKPPSAALAPTKGRTQRPLVLRPPTAKDTLRAATSLSFTSIDVPTPHLFWAQLQASDLAAVVEDEEEASRATIKTTLLWIAAMLSIVGAIAIVPIASDQWKPLPKPPTYIVVNDPDLINALLTPSPTVTVTP